MSNKIKLHVLFGGKSGEHEVSKQTAKSVMNAVDTSRYDIHPIYITEDGAWKSLPRLSELEDINLLIDRVREVASASFSDEGLSVPQRLLLEKAENSTEVIFPLLHGPNGEDGTVQGLLELANLPYVGAGVMASAVAMDKVMMKTVFDRYGLEQGDYLWYIRKKWQENPEPMYQEVEQVLGYPCFVKPANLGSSVGINKARNREELEKAFHEAFLYDRKIVVEEFLDAREIEIGVLGNDDPEVSVAGEIVPSGEFYDYRSKYQDGDTSLIIPAAIMEKTYRTISDMAVRAFKAIDGSGLARVDFFVSRDEDKVWINEVNTMPGFTPYSMYPLLWKHSGLSYPELIDRLIELALERYREKQENKYTLDDN